MSLAIPERIPTVTTDRVVVYIGYFGNTVLNFEMEFGHRLDPRRLARAMDLSMDAEPVLGCRFVEHPWKPYWQRVERNEETFFTFTEDPLVYDEALHAGMDAFAGPMIRACLLRAPDRDRLLLKISHEVADGGGAKHICSVVSEIYNRLAEQPDFTPTPNLAGSRNAYQVLRRLPWHAPLRIFLNYLRRMWITSVPIASISIPAADGPRGRPEIMVRHVPAERVAAMVRYGKPRGSTINDMMTAAFFRAILARSPWDGRSALRVGTTVDFRLHYLEGQKAEGICNLSAFEFYRLGRNPGADYADTLARFTALSSARKRNYLGLSDYVGQLPLARVIPYAWGKKLFARLAPAMRRTRNMPNLLTNMGPIPERIANFDRPATAAWILCPPVYPPCFGAALTGYNGVLTLSAATYPPGLSREAVEDFFDALLAMLPL